MSRHFYDKDIEIEIRPYGKVKIDIVFGGSFCNSKAADLLPFVDEIYKLVDIEP